MCFDFSSGLPLITLDQEIIKFLIVIFSNKGVDFTVHISEARENFNEEIEMDPNKRIELFEVPAHPGVDRSDTLRDFKQVSFSPLLYHC